MFRLIRFLLVTTLVLVSSLYLFLLFVDLNHFKEPIERELASLLNRKVKVERINLKMSLTPSLAVKGVHIYNTKEFNEKATFAQFGEMELSFALVPLFKGQIQLDDISIKDGSVLLIERDGKNNWTFVSSADEKDSKKQVEATEKNAPINLSRYFVHYTSFRNIGVTYVSGEKEEKILIQNSTFTQMKNFFAHIQYNNIPIQLTLASEVLVPSLLADRLSDFALNVNLRGADIKIAGNIGSLSSLKDIDLRVEGVVSNLDLFLKSFVEEGNLPSISQKSGGFSFYITGGIDDLNIKDMKAQFFDFGHLNLNASLKNILAAPKVSLVGDVEVKSAELTSKYGVQPISINFNSLYDDGMISLNKVSVFINKTDFQIDGSVDLRNKIPYIKGDIYSEYFNFEDIIVQDELVMSSSKNQAASVQKKEEKFSLSFLNMLNADIKAKFENLKLFDNAYHKANVHVLLKDAVLTLNPFSLDVLSGDVSGIVSVKGNTEPTEMSLYLKGIGLMISDLPFVKSYLKDSPANLVVELNTKGETVDALLGNLNGIVQAQIPSGVIVNKWFNSLPAAIGAVSKNSAFSYSGAEQYSKLSCAAMKLNIKDGVINSDKNIALETSLINLAVSGDIDLKKKYLSLSLIPSLNQMNNKLNKKLSFAQYVKLQGPFSKIEMKEDVKGALKNVADNKLTDLAQKVAGVELPKEEIVPVGGLCQQALGLEIAQPVVEKKATDVQKTDKSNNKSTLRDVKNSLKDQVKSQLEKSLTNILKKN